MTGDDSVNPKSARVAYDTLKETHDRMEPVLEEFQNQDLTHLESCQQLQNRQARIREMRGVLKERFINE